MVQFHRFDMNFGEIMKLVRSVSYACLKERRVCEINVATPCTRFVMHHSRNMCKDDNSCGHKRHLQRRSCDAKPKCGAEPKAKCGAEPKCGAKAGHKLHLHRRSCDAKAKPKCGAEPKCGAKKKCGCSAA